MQRCFAESAMIRRYWDTVGVMGIGIALMFKEAFPANFRAHLPVELARYLNMHILRCKSERLSALSWFILNTIARRSHGDSRPKLRQRRVCRNYDICLGRSQFRRFAVLVSVIISVPEMLTSPSWLLRNARRCCDDREGQEELGFCHQCEDCSIRFSVRHGRNVERCPAQLFGSDAAKIRKGYLTYTGPLIFSRCRADEIG